MKLKIVVKFIIIVSVVSLKARYIPQSIPSFFLFLSIEIQFVCKTLPLFVAKKYRPREIHLR